MSNNDAVYEQIWKSVGCTTQSRPSNWSRTRTTDQLILDSARWATFTDDERRKGCYGEDRSKWPTNNDQTYKSIWKYAGCTTDVNVTNWSRNQTSDQLINDSAKWATSATYTHRAGCYGEDPNKWPTIINNDINYQNIWKFVGCTTNAPVDNSSRSKTISQLINDSLKTATSTDDASRTKCYGSDKTKWPGYTPPPTTRPPTTNPPTMNPPTTNPPTTRPPTTNPPTTRPPTTNPPTTRPPTTNPPTTSAATTNPPTTNPITTGPPTTSAPTTNPITTGPPTTSTPTTNPITTGPPTTSAPTTNPITTGPSTTRPPTSPTPRVSNESESIQSTSTTFLSEIYNNINQIIMNNKLESFTENLSPNSNEETELLRLNLLNDTYRKRYIDYIQIILVIVIALVCVWLCRILENMDILSSQISDFALITILGITVIIVYVLYQNIQIHNIIDYDQIDYKQPALDTSTPGPTTTPTSNVSPTPTSSVGSCQALPVKNLYSDWKANMLQSLPADINPF